LKKFFAEDLSKHLQNFEILAKLYSTGCNFFVGNSLIWVDFEVFDMLDFLIRITNELSSTLFMVIKQSSNSRPPSVARVRKIIFISNEEFFLEIIIINESK